MRMFIKKNAGFTENDMYTIVSQMKQYIIDNIDDKKLLLWDAYLEDNHYNEFDGEVLTARTILTLGASCIDYTESQDYFIIKVDFSKITRKNTAKLYDICKMINFGTLQMKAYPIFTDTFNYFSKLLHDRSLEGNDGS